MADLIPAPFADLVTRLFLEPRTQDAIFELPRRKWYLPKPTTPDLSVQFHNRCAGNAAGPAAGPHTQMAQNLLLSYVAGGRILELKTVQVNDQLTIGRPCIDMTNVGYNIEWSQELRVEDSLREYVAGAMLIEMFRRDRQLSDGKLAGPAGEVIHDISVGYDLAGIRGDKVRRFLDGMRDARGWVERLRAEIPHTFAEARDSEYPTRLSDSITLSTFHGCPAVEIEAICEFLIGEMDFDVIVKMNPPTLGKEKLEHLLFEVLGYTQLTVNPTAYDAVVSFDESVQLCRRLTAFAAQRGRRLGCKFSNTLEVVNHRQFFTPDNRIMYLSGQPLYVITMTLTDEFRQAVGPEVPISFSAGIDRHNFPHAVACGFVPVTVSSDLLRPGGYGRFGGYLQQLEIEMGKCQATNVDEFIVRRFRESKPSTENVGPRQATSSDALTVAAGVHDVRLAGLRNTTLAAEAARRDPRYRAVSNTAVPKRIDSHLEIFDCITCDKCLPVCPNAANFTYPTPLTAFDYHDVLIADGPSGPRWQDGPPRRFEITETMQIACYADFCNECGNCDTFCPEYGGPYIKKPTFFGSHESWRRAAPRDGFVVRRLKECDAIDGRMLGDVYSLQVDAAAARSMFRDGKVEVDFSASRHTLVAVRWLGQPVAEHRLNLWAYHTLRHLLAGVLDSRRINQVNAGVKDAEGDGISVGD